jgi:hypothetical protein
MAYMLCGMALHCKKNGSDYAIDGDSMHGSNVQGLLTGDAFLHTFIPTRSPQPLTSILFRFQQSCRPEIVSQKHLCSLFAAVRGIRRTQAEFSSG